MKYLFTIFVVFITSTSFAQTTDCDSIVWNSHRKLSWSDFKAKAILTGPAAARTNYNFLHRWHIENGVLTGKMVCIFSPCKSWSRNLNSADLLTHEQGHFDIAEYYRRVYNKRILEEVYTPQTLRLVVLKAYVDIQLECARLEDQYDKETNHSLLKEKQAEWLNKINTMLNSMKDYDKEEVTLKL